MKGLVAVPVHNEAESLPSVISELGNAVLLQNTLFVDDGSTDASAAILQKAGAKVVSHSTNLGYLGAMHTAMDFMLAGPYDFIIFFDADGQHKSSDLAKIINCWEERPCDLLIGSRYREVGERSNSWRRIGTQLFSQIAGCFSGEKITDATSGLKLISRRFVPLTLNLPAVDLHAELIIGLARAGASIREIPITVRPRDKGESMYGTGRSLYYPLATMVCIMRILLSKTVKP